MSPRVLARDAALVPAIPSEYLLFTRTRRAHYLFAASLFGIPGFHAGVWAVQLAPLAAGLRLDPARLGAAVTVAAAAGLVTLFAGEPAGLSAHRDRDAAAARREPSQCVIAPVRTGAS